MAWEPETKEERLAADKLAKLRADLDVNHRSIALRKAKSKELLTEILNQRLIMQHRFGGS